jgi:hypothetical protein
MKLLEHLGSVTLLVSLVVAFHGWITPESHVLHWLSTDQLEDIIHVYDMLTQAEGISVGLYFLL